VLSLPRVRRGSVWRAGGYESYGTVLLFAGGVRDHASDQPRCGILSLLFRMGRLDEEGLCSSGRCDVEMLEWVRPWMDELLEMPTRGNSLEDSTMLRDLLRRMMGRL